MNNKKRTSVERRLFEAFSRGRGLSLSGEDVEALLFDDAVGCRITNAACAEEGLDESAADEVFRSVPGETWAQFKQRLRNQQFPGGGG